MIETCTKAGARMLTAATLLLSTLMLTVISLSACVNNIADDDDDVSYSSSGTPIRITSFGLHSQIYTDERQQAVGVYVTSSTSNLSKKRYVSNEKYLCLGSGFNAERSGVCYPADTKCTIFSYYPYQEDGLKDKSFEMTVEVNADQTGDVDYNESDFMTATAEGVESDEADVELTYEHKFARLNILVNITDGTDMADVLAANPEVKIINTYTKATYNISTCEFSDYESMTSITPNGEWSISGTNLTGKRVLLLPQIVDAGRTLAVVTIGAKSYSASLQSSYTFESGTSLNLVVDCEPSSEVNNSHCNVSNWIEGGNLNLKPEAIDEYDALYPDEMDFDDVPVKYVMIDYTNVAQICRELLWRGDEPCQALVLYPMKENKADLTNGLLLRMIGVDADEHGGKISWNKDTNTYTYTDGIHPAIDKLYFRQDGTYSTLSSDDDVWIGTRSANYIDLRADTAYYYNLVKIGTQYWFSEDLHATKYTDGSNITHKKTSTSLSSSAAGYFLNGDSGGYLYNKKSIAGGKLISTKECHIATYGDWSTLKSYLHKNSALIKYGAKWGSSSTLNLSGFSAIATGYYADDGSKATLVSDGSAAAYWSMGYSQTEPWETSVMISTESDDFGEVLPSDYCGYSVRCIMN